MEWGWSRYNWLEGASCSLGPGSKLLQRSQGSGMGPREAAAPSVTEDETLADAEVNCIYVCVD